MEAAVLLRVVHMGFDDLVESGLACYAPHNEAGEHGLDMAMLTVVETLDGHSFSCRAPIAGRLVHGIADEMETCQSMALLDRMQPLQLVPVYSRIGDLSFSTKEVPVRIESDLEVRGPARVLSCLEVL